MDAERWQKVKGILDAVAEAPIEERDARLVASCGGDRELRWDVERLLALEEEAEDFIEQPVWNSARTADSDTESPSAEEWVFGSEKLKRGDRIGPYRIERLLGQGGMGEVYLATREDDFEQRVAIKRMSADVAGPGLASRGAKTRFLHERQILANLQHPLISRLLDGGTTEDGQPYLVMEYVEGLPIDVYCERHQLSIRQRIELFRKVCEAVHYAHQNLVVHRDLKAGNILVTERGTPRLLDFGIAKLLESEKSPGHFATVAGNAPMTPAYASPEQFLGDAITTACDIYALGILLYKLLCDHMPYRVVGLAYAQLVRVICVVDPVRPSSRVGRSDGQRAEDGDRPEARAAETAAVEPVHNQVDDGTDPSQLPTLADPSLEQEPIPSRRSPRSRRWRRQLRGDLDAIVMKALRKEPTERYNSAALFSEDLRRHLVGLPVVAHQGSWRYYTGKFVRRNKLVLLVALLVTLSAITSTVLWLQAEEERDEAKSQQERAERQQARAERQQTLAERHQARAERLVEVMEDLLRSADPEHARGAEVTVREVLGRGRAQFDQTLADEPDLYAEMLGTLGSVYDSLGIYDLALEAKEDALEKARVAYTRDDPDHVELASHLNNLANHFHRAQEIERAEALQREALEIRRRFPEDWEEVVKVSVNLASILQQKGELDEAESLVEEAIEIGREQGGGGEVFVSPLYNLGAIKRRRGELDAAEQYLAEALGSLEGSESSLLLEARVTSTLARVHFEQERFEEAWSTYERSLAIRARFQDSDHPDVLNAKIAYAGQLGGHEGMKERLCELVAEILPLLKARGDPSEGLAQIEHLGSDCSR